VSPPRDRRTAGASGRLPRDRRKRPRLHWSGHLLAPALIALLFAVINRGDVEPVPPPESVAAPPPAVPPAQVNPWRAAARLVEEDRGAPVGRAARVHPPAELQHYPDRRRFLAVQVAAWKEEQYPLPHDDAELASLILHGDLVEVPPLGDDYILYGVGANATGDPFALQDGATGDEIPLFPRYDVFEDAAAQWSATVEARRAAAAEASAEARKLPAGQARRRRALLGQARQATAEAAALERQAAKVKAWYDDYDRRRRLVAEWQTLDELAHHLGKRAYDLDDPKDRRALRGRMLSFIRKPARDMMLELAKRYHETFSRPLPVTSLVRTLAYQAQLGETNPNATRIAVPPHTTGLAFDVYDHYMTGPEQDALMDMVAERERAGRVEALRENRDHIHIFTFADGRRPGETLIAETLGDVRPVRPPAVRMAGVEAAATRATAAVAGRPGKASALRATASAHRAPARRTAAAVRHTGQRARRH